MKYTKMVCFFGPNIKTYILYYVVHMTEDEYIPMTMI